MGTDRLPGLIQIRNRSDCRPNLRFLDEPFLGRGCVGDGFLSGESLRGDDEKNSFRIDALQNLRQMSSVDVGHKVNVGTDLEGIKVDYDLDKFDKRIIISDL